MWRETLNVRLWSLRNVFLLWFIKPSIIEISDARAVVRVPLNWRTTRHDIHGMYLGTLCMGADVAGGLIAFNLVRRSKAWVTSHSGSRDQQLPNSHNLAIARRRCSCSSCSTESWTRRFG